MQNNTNWARWRPSTPEEIIGDTTAQHYDCICEEADNPMGERCFLIHGAEGRGKTTIATFAANEYADHDSNVFVHKGTKVTQSVVDEMIYSSHMLPMHGTRRAIVINEVDNIHRDVQDCLHDWLQDELPSDYLVIVTTNKKPCRREEWDAMSKSEKDEHLTPKFSSRFMWFEIKTLSTEEVANELVRLCKIPHKAALVCAKNGNGDIRHTLKEVQKAITIHKIKQRRQQNVIV